MAEEQTYEVAEIKYRVVWPRASFYVPKGDGGHNHVVVEQGGDVPDGQDGAMLVILANAGAIKPFVKLTTKATPVGGEPAADGAGTEGGPTTADDGTAGVVLDWDPRDYTVEDVLSDVGDDAALAQAVATLEAGGKARQTLLDKLHAIAEG